MNLSADLQKKYNALLAMVIRKDMPEDTPEHCEQHEIITKAVTILDTGSEMARKSDTEASMLSQYILMLLHLDKHLYDYDIPSATFPAYIQRHADILEVRGEVGRFINTLENARTKCESNISPKITSEKPVYQCNASNDKRVAPCHLCLVDGVTTCSVDCIYCYEVCATCCK